MIKMKVTRSYRGAEGFPKKGETIEVSDRRADQLERAKLAEKIEESKKEYETKVPTPKEEDSEVETKEESKEKEAPRRKRRKKKN